jgi:hypothetical protein
MRLAHGSNDKFSIVEGSVGTQDGLADLAWAPDHGAWHELRERGSPVATMRSPLNMQQRKWSPEWASMI